ncbi:MAG TPA: hypothetical protein PK413_16745, partial [Thermoanaerobaculia bacterium]|nr:hypothetical protein [Thermoanaerobaculia bacterium]
VVVCIDEFELDDPGNTTLVSRLLSELVARGELAAAIPWLEHYCQDREADLPAREALAELHFRVAAGGLAGEKRDFEAAEAHLRRGQELAPAAPRWPLVLGALLALEGRNEEAGSVLGEAVALAPDRPEPRLLATLVAARLADRVAFEAGLEAFRRRWPAHPGGRRLEAARVALAFARGAWSDAADLMLEDDPAESRWQELLPACLYRAGRDAELERLSGPALGPAFWQAASLARRGLFFEAEARLRALRLAHSGSAEPGRALARLCRREALELARRGDREACAEALVEARSLAFVAPLPEAPLPEAPLPEASLPEAPWEPHLAGLLLVLAGRREQGLAVLEQGWRGAPGDGTLLHTLAVASYHGACLASRQPAMPPEALSEAWERTVATWVALLHLEDFQAEWVGGALARYRLEAPGPTSNFSRSLVTTLPGLLERAMEGSEAPILPRWQLARELRAASLLAAAGGFTPG